MSDNYHTVRLHRVLRAPPARVYKAFLDPHAKARWLPPYGFLGQVHEDNPTVGGTYRMSFTNFGTGSSHWFHGEYKELVPNERIVYTDEFDDPGLPGVIKVTVEVRAVGSGTELHITQENLPAAIPVDSCYVGWQESLQQLARLVEPQIPDES